MKLALADYLIIGIAIVFIGWLYQHYWFARHEPAAYAWIQVANHPPQQVALQSSRQLRLQGLLGASVVEIANGQIRFLSAPCQARHCIHAGWLRHNGDFAACLPNRISIELKSEGGTRFDAIVY